MFGKCKHDLEKPLIVSGYGMTEYEILFCRECGKVLWKKTKDYDNQYPKIIKNKMYG